MCFGNWTWHSLFVKSVIMTFLKRSSHFSIISSSTRKKEDVWFALQRKASSTSLYSYFEYNEGGQQSPWDQTESSRVANWKLDWNWQVNFVEPLFLQYFFQILQIQFQSRNYIQFCLIEFYSSQSFNKRLWAIITLDTMMWGVYFLAMKETSPFSLWLEVFMFLSRAKCQLCKWMMGLWK